MSEDIDTNTASGNPTATGQHSGDRIGIVTVTIDCADPRGLATFWTEALGYKITADYGGEFVLLGPASGEQAVGVGLQRVAEEKVTKNRVHLDFHTPDRAAEVARLVGLGATPLGEHAVPGLSWTTLTDPAGNEFCVGSTNG
ncbi:VOC family protein [Actinokineospora auranticolor]|nr:VOC family protein [Actinokineospora auranticolor]